MTDDVRHAPPLIDKLRAHGKASDSIAWNGQARQLLLWAADAIEAANVALSETAPGGMSKDELNYLLISTAPDGQWADQAVHSYCAAIRARVGASPKGSDEVWEVYNRTTSTLLATEEDADRFLSSFSPSVGMTKTRRHVLRHFER